MSKLDMQAALFDSQFSGLRQIDTVTTATPYPGVTLAPGETRNFIISQILPAADTISLILVNYQNLEGVWRPADGVCGGYFGSSQEFFIETLNYFVGSTLYIANYIGNNTGGSVNVPAIVFNVKTSIYKAPF